jgi:UDP-GlcNAc:undecaprenyl-phosphate/decaprenyl-phosphate GlcNAc-1-phosphate transferase
VPADVTPFLLALCGAAGVSFLLTPVVRRLALTWRVLDKPDPRKVHAGLVPRWGGVAVGVAVALVFAVVLFTSPGLRAALLSAPHTRWLALGLGALAILVAGMIDDARGLPAWPKLIIEIAAAALVVWAAPAPHAVALGSATAPHELGVLESLFAVLWIVTLTNAVNMTDVVDGVAGGLGAIAALALGIVAIALGRVVAPVVLLGLAGALLGYLPHNFRAHRIFLGDSGSLVIGFLLGAGSLVGLTENGVWLALPAVLALGMPLAECGITVLRRTARAVTIERSDTPRERFVLKSGPPHLFTADARHIPHRLLGLGLSRPAALAVLYGSAVTLGALAWVAVRWPWIGLWGGVAAALILAYAATRWWYEELRLLDRGALLPLFDNPFVHRRLTHAAYDAVATALALLVANALVPPPALALAGAAWGRVLVVVGATLAGLYLSGIYRAAFLNAGLAEALHAARGVVLGAGLSWLAWRVLFARPWPVAGWVLFTYVLLTLVVGGRMLSRLLLHAHERATRGRRRALIFGAGRAGLEALGGMLRDPALGFLPLGFVDDDPRLWGVEVHGYPVHGGGVRLEEILERVMPGDLVLTPAGAGPGRREEIAALCRRHGVGVVDYSVQWKPVTTAGVKDTPVPTFSTLPTSTTAGPA